MKKLSILCLLATPALFVASSEETQVATTSKQASTERPVLGATYLDAKLTEQNATDEKSTFIDRKASQPGYLVGRSDIRPYGNENVYFVKKNINSGDANTAMQHKDKSGFHVALSATLTHLTNQAQVLQQKQVDTNQQSAQNERTVREPLWSDLSLVAQYANQEDVRASIPANDFTDMAETLSAMKKRNEEQQQRMAEETSAQNNFLQKLIDLAQGK